MEAVSSFPWDNVMTTFATQGKAYKELALKLEKDPYYGFEEESSKYGSALVGDLYHISRKLLVEHLGDQNLDKYKCKAHPTKWGGLSQNRPMPRENTRLLPDSIPDHKESYGGCVILPLG